MNEGTSTKKFALGQWLWWKYTWLVTGVLVGLMARHLEAAGVPMSYSVTGALLVSLIPIIVGAFQSDALDVREGVRNLGEAMYDLLMVSGACATVASYVPNERFYDGCIIMVAVLPLTRSVRALHTMTRVPWKNAPVLQWPLWSVNNIPMLGMCVMLLMVMLASVVYGDIALIPRLLERPVDMLVLWGLAFLTASLVLFISRDGRLVDDFK